MIKRFIQTITILVILIVSQTSLNAKERKSQKKQVIIGYAKNTAKKDIKTLEQKFDLKVVKKFKRIHAICYEVQSDKELPKFITLLQREKIVRYAERNGKVDKR
tara:strand:- start:229 stop:540 length:312 start_codon:yes stop_codon:yes gene_type:complete